MISTEFEGKMNCVKRLGERNEMRRQVKMVFYYITKYGNINVKNNGYVLKVKL